ncbi:hypothetical protein HAX54_003688 [Datura stramonium]|uniref:Uncharacterized protein n=1 Tax=Datura stramonium TaxID=4076 RepID=A0ABS8RTS6_DATST|nr:hypothetical protein [Datura stramonium]
MACHHHQPKGRPVGYRFHSTNRKLTCLEEIEIKLCVDRDQPVARDAVDDIPASFLDMTFNHLRTIKIYDIAGAGAEMQLIKGTCTGFHPTPSLREEAAKHIWNYIGRAVGIKHNSGPIRRVFNQWWEMKTENVIHKMLFAMRRKYEKYFLFAHLEKMAKLEKQQTIRKQVYLEESFTEATLEITNQIRLLGSV